MKQKVILAFYKGNEKISNKLISWWTNSKYSHVELIVDGFWYSVTSKEPLLKTNKIIIDEENWKYIDVEIDIELFESLYKKHKDAKYDWLGIFFSQVIPINRENPNRLFCSEWCALALGLESPNSYSPGHLYSTIKTLKNN